MRTTALDNLALWKELRNQMRVRMLLVMLGVLAIASTFSLVGCHRPAVTDKPNPTTPMELVLPDKGAYTGAYIDFGEAEEDVTLEVIEEFEALVGKHQAIIASSSYWGEQDFPTESLKVIWRHKSVPLIFWSPWDRPYEQHKGPDRFGLDKIIAGNWDNYIDRWADSAKAFGQPMLVSFCNEMNGDWFPWSGIYYGGNEWDAQHNNWKGPEVFRNAYRYVVDRVRSRGARNVKWVFHTNNYPYPYDVWNLAAAYYPGSAYVDWLGLSVYGQQFKDEPWANVPSLVDWPYQEISQLDPSKPIMIAEWATGEFPRSGSKADWIKEGLDLFRSRYPRVKAAIYWHERWQNPDQSYSNLRVNSSVESLKAYRDGVANQDWLGEVIMKPVRQ
jgi:hypothetical protein